MSNQLEKLRMQATALVDALEAVVPEYRSLELRTAFGRPLLENIRPPELVAGMRQALDDLLTMVGHLSGGQMRAIAADLRTRHGIELDSLQQKRLRRIASIREQGRVASETQWYLIRSRIDEIEGLEARADECHALQRLADAYEFRPAKA